MSLPGRCILLAVLAAGSPLAFAAGQGEAVGGDPDKPLAIAEVFELRLTGDVLRLHTPLPPTPAGDVRAIDVPALGGPAELTHVGVPPDDDDDDDDAAKPGGPGEVPEVFKLEAADHSRPGERVGLVVSWQDGVLDVQRSVHFTGPRRFTRLVRLLATANPEFGLGPSVQLMVSEAGDVGGGRKPLRILARAKTFPGLLRRHPREVAAYLRPLLRELGQEAVFVPDARVTWQVFADRLPPPAASTERAVAGLLPQLDADDGAAREAAGERLAALGRDAVLVLLRLDRSALSAEQNTRIDALLANHAPLSRSEVIRLRRDVGFLLDCLNSDDAVVRAAWPATCGTRWTGWSGWGGPRRTPGPPRSRASATRGRSPTSSPRRRTRRGWRGACRLRPGAGGVPGVRRRRRRRRAQTTTSRGRSGAEPRIEGRGLRETDPGAPLRAAPGLDRPRWRG
jgi:hypothetical protein